MGGKTAGKYHSAGLAIAILGVLAFLAPSGPLSSGARNIIHILSAVFCFYPSAALLLKGKKNAIFLALGTGAFLAGNLFRATYEAILGRSVPTVAPHAVLFVLGHVLLMSFLSLELLTTVKERSKEAPFKIIGIMIPSAAIGSIFWKFSLEEGFRGIPSEQLIGGGFAFVISAAIFLSTLLSAPKDFEKSTLYLSGAYFSFALTSFLYLSELSKGTYSSSSMANLGWIVALVFLGISVFSEEEASGLPRGPEEGKKDPVKAD